VFISILISGRKSYRLVSSTDKKTGVHSRIIWCCSWTHDSKHFITGSRDGKVAVWGHQSAACEIESPRGQYTLSSKPLELPDQSVTALAVAPIEIAPHVYLVAIGLENGCINIYKWSSVSGESGDNWQTCLQLNNSYPFCSILMTVFYVCISSFLQCILIYVGCLPTKIVHLSAVLLFNFLLCPSFVLYHAIFLTPCCSLDYNHSLLIGTKYTAVGIGIMYTGIHFQCNTWM